MGEIAEMMLEGILCEACGELIDETGSGHPRRCAGCDISPRTLRSVKRVIGRERQAARHNRERPVPPPKSDRDLIRLRHGEEAARMFDDLLRRHAPPKDPAPEPVPPPATVAAAASAGPAGLPPPPGNPPD